MNSRWRLPFFSVLALIASGPFSTVRAQSTKPNDDPIQSLLTEVRLLRRTLQRTGLNAYRSQLIVEGLRMHDDKVVRLTRQLDDLREEISKIDTTIPRMAEQVKLMESMIEQEMDPVKRSRLEFEAKDLKRSIEQYKVRQERQRERETQVSAQLKEEQSKLTDLESRLDALEREIEIEIQTQKSQDAEDLKKRP